MFSNNIVLIFFSFLHLNNAQILGDSYVCVPEGYCNNSQFISDPTDIDPRILTSDEICADGTIPCYTQGPNSFCGKRFIPQTSTADGPANWGVYPWQAYLRYTANKKYAGSGVLIDNFHVLTAAHRVDKLWPSSIMVIMGAHNPQYIAVNTQTRNVSNIFLHTNYMNKSLVNDIAILRVSPAFNLSENNVNTACLPIKDRSFVGQRCVVAGWGQTSFTEQNAPTTTLKQVYVRITNYTNCRSSYVNILGLKTDYYLDGAGEICAGGEAMKDACTHDGGAPLICQSSNDKSTVAGLVIWGKNCGRPGVYGVYVNVAHYIDWIQAIISNYTRN